MPHEDEAFNFQPQGETYVFKKFKTASQKLLDYEKPRQKHSHNKHLRKKSLESQCNKSVFLSST